MTGRRSLVPAAASLLLASAVVAACGGGGSAAPGVRTVTVTPAQARPVPTPAPTPTRPQTKLGGRCDTLLPLTAVQQAMGTLFSGRTEFVVGVREPNIGRLSYLNCRYGIPPKRAGGTAEPLVEIGVSLYRTSSDAAQRVRSTVFDYLGAGARREHHTVAGNPAVLLVGGIGEGYTVPLLVVTAGQRTVAVSLAERAGPKAERWRSMVALAELALDRTRG